MDIAALTHSDWYTQLYDNPPPGTVNFGHLQIGKLKPVRKETMSSLCIRRRSERSADMGFSLNSLYLPATDAWERYGVANGVKSVEEFTSRFNDKPKDNREPISPIDSPKIGCLVLSNAILFDQASFFTPEEYGLRFANEAQRFIVDKEMCLRRALPNQSLKRQF